jgi:hypothetical protein
MDRQRRAWYIKKLEKAATELHQVAYNLLEDDPQRHAAPYWHETLRNLVALKMAILRLK